MRVTSTSLFFVALICSQAWAINPPSIQVILHSPTPQIAVVRVNRAGQIATTYLGDGNTDHLFFYGPQLSVDIPVPGTDIIDLNLSNWGASLYGAGGGEKLLAAPIGQPPQEFFRPSFGGSTIKAAINDSGQMAFFARTTARTGYQDAYSVEPGQTPQLLPDLHEKELEAPPLIDAQGRIVALHNIAAPSSIHFFRITPGQSWENLTGGRLPSGTTNLSTMSTFDGRTISSDGDFVFEGDVPVAGKARPQVFLWDDSARSVVSLMDISSKDLDDSGNPRSLDALTTFADDNSLWLVASRNVTTPEFKYLYRRGDGTTLDIGALLPAGYSVFPSNEAHSLSYNGDLWLAAKNSATNRIHYFLLHDNQLISVLGDVSEMFLQPVLTDSHDVYFWRASAGGGSDLVRIQVTVPEPETLGLFLIGFVAVAVVRRRKY